MIIFSMNSVCFGYLQYVKKYLFVWNTKCRHSLKIQNELYTSRYSHRLKYPRYLWHFFFDVLQHVGPNFAHLPSRFFSFIPKPIFCNCEDSVKYCEVGTNKKCEQISKNNIRIWYESVTDNGMNYDTRTRTPAV